jgi:hypothetical protein
LTRTFFAFALILALAGPARSADQQGGQEAGLVRIQIQFLGVQGWVPAAWVPEDQVEEGYPLQNHPELRRRFELPGEAGPAELHIDADMPDPEVQIEALVESRNLLESPQLRDENGEPVEAAVTRLVAGRSGEMPVIVAEAWGVRRRRVGRDWEAVPDQAWIRAVIGASGGAAVVTLQGPSPTISANRGAFDRFLTGLETGVAPVVIGRLVEAGTGRPLVGEVGVSQAWSEGRETTMTHDVVRTRSDGTFAIYDRPYGPGQLGGIVENHGRAYGWVFIEPSATQTVEIALPVAGAIRGVVVDPEGLPRSGVELELRYERGTSPPEAGREEVAARVRAEGQRFAGVGDGRRMANTRGLGEFVFLGIDPDRPFHLELRHDELGEVTTDVMVLAPGEVLDALRIVIGARADGGPPPNPTLAPARFATR